MKHIQKFLEFLRTFFYTTNTDHHYFDRQSEPQVPYVPELTERYWYGQRHYRN